MGEKWGSASPSNTKLYIGSCSEREHVEEENGSSHPKQPQRKTPNKFVTPSSTKSSEATNEEGLSERQKRRKRVGWALHQRRTGKSGNVSQKAEKPSVAQYSREVEAQLCSQIQVCFILPPESIIHSASADFVPTTACRLSIPPVNLSGTLSLMACRLTPHGWPALWDTRHARQPLTSVNDMHGRTISALQLSCDDAIRAADAYRAVLGPTGHL